MLGKLYPRADFSFDVEWWIATDFVYTITGPVGIFVKQSYLSFTVIYQEGKQSGLHPTKFARLLTSRRGGRDLLTSGGKFGPNGALWTAVSPPP